MQAQYQAMLQQTPSVSAAPGKRIALALTGASGMPYGARLLQCLLASGAEVWLLYSQVAQVVARQEMDWALPTRAADVEVALASQFDHLPGKLRVFGREEWFAPVASGSSPADAMVICPCTMGTLAAIASGMSDNLIERAADVMLKEQKKVIVVPREAPFSVIHLENMLKLAKAGAVILPPNPGFYHHPEKVLDIIDFVVARILDHLHIGNDLIRRWG
ncbi:4-hydroxy-3-polyprenylbenzoate decarboxylase [Chitinivorax tropicus]|uniref:Flavin prenyltransferase UbiX n=1 Tax=Chitinivorax tropicus TaxID=714531 RepID=A0A840MJT1_9PROT|nr:flavin prenyltransferase UbiX [Chitinivorax tropicus]MBB5019454.1 4-hydroxy-3-polyprenylbenzoate decarboxylase [Chitinivorax tropicus]